MKVGILVLLVVIYINTSCKGDDHSVDPILLFNNSLFKYLAYNDSKEAKSWEEANIFCRNGSTQGRLAVLNNKNLIRKIKRKLRLNPKSKEFWIGLKKNSTEYIWTNGNSLNQSLKDQEKHDEVKCYTIKKGGKADFKRRDCDDEKMFICETSQIPGHSVDYILLLNNSLKYLAYNNSKEAKSWEEANIFCRNGSTQGRLAVLNNKILISEIKSNLASNGYKKPQKFWIGLKKNSTDYIWTNGKSLNQSLKAQEKDDEVKCYTIKKRGKVGFKRRDCDDEKMFICETSQIPGHSVDYILLLNNSLKYLAYNNSKGAKSWEEANEFCNGSKQGRLAVLNNKNLISEIKRKLKLNGYHRSKEFWIGLKKNRTDYIWTNGKSLNQNLQLKAQEKDDEVKCYTIKKGGKADFKRRDCEDEKMFICETPQIPEQPLATTDTTNYYPQGSLTTTIHHVVMTTTAAVSSSKVTATPSISSSSSVECKETPSMQASQFSWHSSAYMRTTSDINPTKTRSVQPSTSVIPPSTKREKMDNFLNFMKKSNTSNPDSMSLLLTEYDGVMKRINEQDDQEDIKGYNPLTLARDIENFALEFTKKHLGSNKTKMSITKKDIVFHAMMVDADLDSDVTFPEENEDPQVNTISLPKSLFKGQETFIVNVVYKNNKTIRKLTPIGMEGKPDDNKTWSLNTELFSLTIFPKRKQLSENVNITLRHLQKINGAEPHCSFWNFSIRTNYNGSWSRQGCEVLSSTGTHTVCTCNHLTNFAVLMKLNDQETSPAHKEALLVITYVGLVLSIVGEIITVLLYSVFLNLRHEKSQIRVNLLCALAAAQIVFLTGIDKTENKDVCTLVASLIHLLYLVSFCWMLMEGVYLYRMVVQVFDAHITMSYSYVFAFGFPLGVLAISLITAAAQSEGIYSYVSTKHCWIRFENGFIWSFIAPVLILIAINSFFLFSVLKEMAFMKSVKTLNSLELSSIRASARACVVLLPLLGITWLFGLLSIVTTHVAWQYVFTILNAMQGFMIFVLHCLRNTELRAAIELRYFQWESSHGKHRSSTPSKFLTFDESEKSRTNSLPMTTKVNQIMPKKDGSTA